MLRNIMTLSIAFIAAGTLFLSTGCTTKESSTRVDSSVTKVTEAPVTKVTNNTIVTAPEGQATKVVSGPTVTHTENIINNTVKEKNTVTEKTVMPQSSDASGKCIGNIEQLGNACKKYAGLHGGEYPDSLSELSEKSSGSVTLLEKLPTCPIDNGDYEYEVSEDGKYFGIWCSQNHSADTAKPMPSGYPQFDSATGLMTPANEQAAQTQHIKLPDMEKE